MLRHALALALLAMPEAAFARPLNTETQPAKVVTNATSTPVCTHVRRKTFHPAEGWSVKTVSMACKSVTAALRQPGNQTFTSLETHKSVKAK